MVRRTLRVTCGRFVAPAERGDLEWGSCPPFNGPFDELGNRLIVDGGLILTTIPASGSGYLPVIFVSGFLARSSVPGTWVPSKFLGEITPVSFRLALPSNYRISPTFHVSLLKPAGGSRGAEDQEEAEDHGAPPIIIDGEEVYRVQEILDSRRRGRVIQYLWIGRGTARRSGPGSAPRTFWILLSPLTSIGPIRKSQPRDHVEGPGVVCLLTSGAARRRGALSQIQPSVAPLRSPPEGGITGLLTSPFGLHFPWPPYLRLITCTGADH